MTEFCLLSQHFHSPWARTSFKNTLNIWEFHYAHFCIQVIVSFRDYGRRIKPLKVFLKGLARMVLNVSTIIMTKKTKTFDSRETGRCVILTSRSGFVLPGFRSAGLASSIAVTLKRLPPSSIFFHSSRTGLWTQ